jgi:hypothetical protein
VEALREALNGVNVSESTSPDVGTAGQ